MQVVILCGGTGTRLREQTELVPKPLIPIGGKPMIWHIMKIFSHWGHNNFILGLGYKQEQFKMYFSHLMEINMDTIIECGAECSLKVVPVPLDSPSNWNVVLSDTGENTMKGGRLKRLERYITENNFMLAYGDGVANINLHELEDFHLSTGKMVTVTGIHPAPRFGEIHHRDGIVTEFSEKPDSETLVNGGFYVMKKEIFEYLNSAEWCDLEAGTLEMIARRKEMAVYQHHGFWKCMDTLKDMGELQQLWDSGKAPWKIW